VEVYQPRVWLPFRDCSSHGVIIECVWTAQPSSQSFLSAHIIARKDMQTAEASKQDILCRPASDAAQLEQALTRIDICVVR
jgi:hypothetical protein